METQELEQNGACESAPGVRQKTPWVKAYLAAYARLGAVLAACKAAKVCRSTVVARRRRDPRFARAEARALDEHTERLERRAVRVAMRATESTGPGVTALFRMLSARKPETYRERGGITINANSSASAIFDGAGRGLLDFLFELREAVRVSPEQAVRGADEAGELQAMGQQADGILQVDSQDQANSIAS